MKIEKISNSQIKVLLNRTDLEERNLKFTELAAYGSERAKEFFREMMEEAVKKFDFSAENIPLMIEAVPLGNDEVMLIVSKVDSDEPTETNINMIPMAFRDRLFVKKQVEDMPEEISLGDRSFLLYSFESLGDVTRLCAQLKPVYEGRSTLYKESGLYYLALSSDCAEGMSADGFEALVSEFGTKHISNAVAKAYLEEHTEVIVADKAVEVLANL